jgi:UDP-N-acetylmuramoyl-L-alanyl-D-glutamate--2,6-diaminopimelate ligase
MRLRQLLDPGVALDGAAGGDPDILSLTADSRAVRPGALFAALAGSKADGRRFVADAVSKGAAAILADPSLAGTALGVPLVLDPEPRRRLALMAARFFGRQPRHVVAVTGTSGKTSVAHLARQIWEGLGKVSASLGTLGLQSPARRIEGGLTTPDPVRLHQLLAELAAEGVEHLAMEASSHGLDQHRLDGVRFEAAAFTNLSHDHLDYHRTFEAYLAAKARLFAELLPATGVAVLHADVPEFARLQAICAARGLAVIDYGREARALRLTGLAETLEGQRLRIVHRNKVHEVRIALVGNFQAANLLAAVGLVLADRDLDVDAVLAAAGSVRGVPGRLELIGRHPSSAPVFVDYAHKPDALDKVLATLRPHVQARLLVVVGCGGDRDREKRPLMGKIAVERADKVFITDDNPRSEDPAAIRRQILAAAPGAVDVADRAEAIHLAVSMLDVGDVLVVAGKGHETGQIVGAQVLPFDDAAVVRAALAEAGGAPSASRHGTRR